MGLLKFRVLRFRMWSCLEKMSGPGGFVQQSGAVFAVWGHGLSVQPAWGLGKGHSGLSHILKVGT